VDRELLDVGRPLHLHPGGGDLWLDPAFEEGIEICPRLPEVDDSPATTDRTTSVRGLPSLDQRDCTTLRRGRGRMSYRRSFAPFEILRTASRKYSRRPPKRTSSSPTAEKCLPSYRNSRHSSLSRWLLTPSSSVRELGSIDFPGPGGDPNAGRRRNPAQDDATASTRRSLDARRDTSGSVGCARNLPCWFPPTSATIWPL
jgi:hypothetical protein